MENLLDDNLKECYIITSEVVFKYYELYELILDNSSNNLYLYEDYILDVLDMVIKEYDMYMKLSLMDINMCLDLIKNIDCDNLMVDARFKHKLEMVKKIYEGIKINSNELFIDGFDKIIDVSLFDSLYSLIDIEIMKKLKKKIDSISSSNYNDLLFIRALNKKFNLVLFNQTYNNSLSEFINLSYNMDC